MAKKTTASPKKPRAAKAAAPDKKSPRASGAKAPVVTENVKMTPAKKLAALLGSARAAYKEGRSIAGELGAEIKEAAEHDHLHKKAFAAVRSADRMEPEALADFFAHRDYYEESLGLRKRANAVVRMNFEDDGQGGEPAAEVAEEGPGARTSNVRAFPAQAAE